MMTRRRFIFDAAKGLIVPVVAAPIVRGATIIVPSPKPVVSVVGGCTFPKTNLYAHWKLDEASGARADSFSTFSLSDTNTVTQTTGKLGNAAQFTRANNQCLSNSSITLGDTKFLVAAWVYMDSKPASVMEICSKATGFGAGGREFELYWDNSVDRIVMGTGGALNNTAVANSFGAPALSTWFYVVAWHDSVADTINIQINNGTVDSAVTSNTFAGTQTGVFTVGSYNVNATTLWCWNGRIDSVSLYKGGIPSSTDRTTLYNSTSGLEYC